MEKRGAKSKNRIDIKWSANFAYAIGLLATDGSVSKDERHIDFTSKDLEQVKHFMKCLNFKTKISTKKSGSNALAYRIQFSDVSFVGFLKDIGITPAKSLTIERVLVPKVFFFDFLRGCFDGDGSSYEYWDKRWKSSFLFYIDFASASRNFIYWLKEVIFCRIAAKGCVTYAKNKKICYQLKYSKWQAIKIIRKMYTKNCPCLFRKKLKINTALAMMGESKV